MLVKELKSENVVSVVDVGGGQTHNGAKYTVDVFVD